MKIGNALVSGAVSFLVLIFLILGATVYLFASGSSDALYINLAGRQRMLSQKIAKETFSYAKHPTPEARAVLERSIEIFERTHRALRMTGYAPLSLDGTNDVPVHASTDLPVLTKLDDVEALWVEMKRDIRDLEGRADIEARALQTIEEGGPRILSLTDDVVALEVALREPAPRVINVAGRQRMLSQKIVVDALLFGQEPSASTRTQMESDVRLFAMSHRALRYGGDTQLSLNAREMGFLAAAADPAVVRKLDQIEQNWNDVQTAIGSLTDENNLSRALGRVADINPRLLKTMDEAVSMSQQQVDSKIRAFRNLQLATSAIAVVIAGLVIVYSNRIGGSLMQLRRAAEDISLGRLEVRVRPVGTGEIRDLARSFERMRISLEAAMSEAQQR